MENMRNIVILKNLPSNIIEEAFVVLKKNQKVTKLQPIDNRNNDFICEKNGEYDSDFIVKEAELLLENYIDNYDDENVKSNVMNLNKKYKRMQRTVAILAGGLFFSVIYLLII